MSFPTPHSYEDTSSEGSSNQQDIKTPSSNESDDFPAALDQPQNGLLVGSPSYQSSSPLEPENYTPHKPRNTGVIFGQTTAMSSPIGAYATKDKPTQSSGSLFRQNLKTGITDAKSPFAKLSDSEQSSKLISDLGKRLANETKQTDSFRELGNTSTNETKPLDLPKDLLTDSSVSEGALTEMDKLRAQVEALMEQRSVALSGKEKAAGSDDSVSAAETERPAGQLDLPAAKDSSVMSRDSSHKDMPTTARATELLNEPWLNRSLNQLSDSTVGTTTLRNTENIPITNETQTSSSTDSLFDDGLGAGIGTKAMFDLARARAASKSRGLFGDTYSKALNELGQPPNLAEPHTAAANPTLKNSSNTSKSNDTTASSIRLDTGRLGKPLGSLPSVEKSSASIPSFLNQKQSQNPLVNSSHSSFSSTKVASSSNSTKPESRPFGVPSRDSSAEHLESRLTDLFGKVDNDDWRPHGTSALFDPEFEARQVDGEGYFQSVCAMPAYTRYSQEELRLADYAAGWGGKRVPSLPDSMDTDFWYRYHLSFTDSPLIRALLSAGRSKASHPDHWNLADHIDSYATNEPFKTFYGLTRETSFARKIRAVKSELAEAEAAEPVPASSALGLGTLSLTDQSKDATTETKIARERLSYYHECLGLWAVAKLDWQEHYERLSAKLQQKPPVTKTEVLVVRKTLDEWEDIHLSQLTNMLETRKKEMEKKVDEIKGSTPGIRGLGTEMIRKHWRLSAALDGL